jgi:hypothetical protein
MCGICGIFHFMNRELVNGQLIRQMAGLIAHRGPDDEGFLVDENMGLGFRRLSIIDLSTGNQPMSDNEKNIWLIFNGEIYNFPELIYANAHRGKVQKASLEAFPLRIVEDKLRRIPSKGRAEMIRKVYEVDPLLCPQCGGKMKVIAFLTDYESPTMG